MARSGLYFSRHYIFANCNKSGLLLDKIYRDEFMKIDYNRYKIISVKAIAGSGKTTLLLNFAKEMNHKKILYLAFNKSIVGGSQITSITAECEDNLVF